MALCHLFKCTSCKAELVGPMAEPGKPGPPLGKRFSYGSPVSCVNTSACRFGKPVIEYAGTGDRIPPAPKPGAPLAVGATVPQKWVPDGEGGYTASAQYSNLPAVPQAALIVELEALFNLHKIQLLGAVYDRFDTYADQLDQAIAPGPAPAEKVLTLPLVLSRLDSVMAAFGAAAVEWNVSVIDRNLVDDANNRQSANLTLPKKITSNGATFRFHLEALNDLINPRGGHALLPADYGAAIPKAIALSAANVAGNDVQGPTHAYYFWSASQNRGINVVLKRNTSEVLTVYYRAAVAAWWAGALTPQMRLDRTV